ncbi:MAG: hypothetical protein JJU05_07465 [Verrucomicrobia bacterium]|nr:hypothetical protein [Verrucomicrobiota bacterium]MCH8527764.1 histidine kinase [Kiritimatiellia bacterium]
MSGPHVPGPDEVVLHLQTGHRQTRLNQEDLEEARDRMRRLFDEVSDVVFVFQKGEVILENERARTLLASVGDSPDALVKEIYVKAGQVLRGLPVTLEWSTPRSNIFLVIHAASALRLEEGNGMLVTLVDLSEAMARTRQLEAADREERRRISRDLHDGLSQLLASLHFQTRALALRKQGHARETLYGNIADLATLCAHNGRQIHHEFFKK